MSTRDEPEPGWAPLPALAGRLGYLLKHARERLAELTAEVLAPFGVTGRQVAVLIAIDERVPLSQQEVARRLGVDRTTMVDLIDELEDKGLVQRRQDPADRRRNVVALTPAGAATLDGASRATQEAERRFLGSLPAPQAAAFREALRAVAFPRHISEHVTPSAPAP
ncbi:MAG TPA: MarR family transcriptional regulator [Streptosporangiaceae bacterium]|nr:MarR family transcriptional regulator [Streptosporangiaceae bacterium]